MGGTEKERERPDHDITKKAESCKTRKQMYLADG